MTTIFLTGATGAMGRALLPELLNDPSVQIRALVFPHDKERKKINAYCDHPNLTMIEGDLRNESDIRKGVQGVDIVLHIGGLVAPFADIIPEKTMQINYGSTIKIIRAIQDEPHPDDVKLIFISSVVVNGDRMPPIHWGRVGDPVTTSVHDYYGVSKIACERAVIESGLKNWAILRQSGMLSKKMAGVEDGIIFHNCLDNVLEYVSDKDTAVLLRKICLESPDSFWGHLYNIGGGASCRRSFYQFLSETMQRLGISSPALALEANWFAIRNFHGMYYLDSDRLESIFHFRSHTPEYFFQIYEKKYGALIAFLKGIAGIRLGEKWLASILYKRFKKLAYSPNGTMYYIKNNIEDRIDPMFISKERWAQIPDMAHFPHFTDWDHVTPIDHGYDQTKPESELMLDDMKQAAQFRGGECLSEKMTAGDMRTKLTWKCAFGHEFEASPRLILEGGHWCQTCEEKSWNNHEIAKRNPFFAQIWYPLHDKDEPSREYPKIVSTKDVV